MWSQSTPPGTIVKLQPPTLRTGAVDDINRGGAPGSQGSENPPRVSPDSASKFSTLMGITITRSALQPTIGS